MCSTAGEPLSVTELTYRTVLYEYYQDRYGDALVATLVAQEQGRTGEDPIRFELAKGSFAFKDGMYAYARETFDGVDPSHLDEVDHLRLAFHLARVHLQRQDWDGLAREVGNIDRIRPVLEEPFAHPELDFMRVELALAAGQPQDGLKALERLKDGDPLKGYSLYNIGVLQRQQGDLAGARQTLSALVDLPVTSADGEDLAERARLALAYMARESEQEQNAELERRSFLRLAGRRCLHGCP